MNSVFVMSPMCVCVCASAFSPLSTRSRRPLTMQLSNNDIYIFVYTGTPKHEQNWTRASDNWYSSSTVDARGMGLLLSSS